MTLLEVLQMSTRESDKVEVKVVVESKDTSSKVILVALTLVLSGVLLVLVTGGGADGFLSPKKGDAAANCGDGIDNDGGGQADRDDPDCYSNPSVWEGYDSTRTEANRDNDPPGGQP